MIAVIYSGSRHADWKLAEKGQIVSEFKTPGIHPFFNDEKYIRQLLNKNTSLINNAEKIKRIYFFGAGASSHERKEMVTHAFADFFKHSKIIVENDLHAAALASCAEKPGIVGIIGSGSNAAYFDGRKIKPNNFGLGYILSDEGSANWLGRILLKSYLNETLPNDFRVKFQKKYDLDRKEILDKIYKQHQPALFLSSFVDFLLENQQDPFVKQLVSKGFNDYVVTCLKPLHASHPDVPVYMVGTVAANFQGWLTEVAYNHGITITSVIKEPIYNVLNYYSHKNQ